MQELLDIINRLKSRPHIDIDLISWASEVLVRKAEVGAIKADFRLAFTAID